MPEPNDEISRQLVRIYKDAIESLQARLLTLDKTDIESRRHYLSVLKQIEDEFEALDERAAEWIKTHVQASYQSGSAEGLRQLRELGVTPTTMLFSKPHQQMAKHLAEGFYYDFHKIVDQSKNSLITFIRQAKVGEAQQSEILKAVARGGMMGAPTRNVTEDILKALKDSIVQNRIAVGDRSYPASYYAELLARTHLRVAFTRGTETRLAENGVDLAQISAHGTDCALCAEFENKVFSISGTSPDYPPMDILPNGGPPFHPHCLHVISGFIPELKSEEQVAEAQWTGVEDAKAARINENALAEWEG